MQLGEAVAQAVLIPHEGECPFCDSTDKVGEKELNLVNDSTKLISNLGKMPEVFTPDPIPLEKYYYIKGKYSESEKKTESQICLNAHHLIPGNASLAASPKLLRWLAKTVTVSKKYVSNPVEVKVKKVPKAEQDAKRRKLYEEKNEVILGNPKQSIIFSTTEGRSTAVRSIEVEGWVTGIVPYDINHEKNGVWLPSNNAVCDWKKVKSLKVEDVYKDIDKSKKPMKLGLAYAYNAMDATDKQFHDAHPEYSDEVLAQIMKLEQELEKMAVACHDHDKSESKEEGPYPAPARLDSALYELARRIEVLLNGSFPRNPWITSNYVRDIFLLDKK